MYFLSCVPMKSNKKFLQTLAALLILVFHLWIPVSQWKWEHFIIKTGYIGVDLFFFLSACSLAEREFTYGNFIQNRFTIIYSKFLFFVLIAAFYKKFEPLRVIKILTGLEFFERGGGAFLWFIPAILIFYLLYPLFVKWKFPYKVLIVMIAWFVLSYLTAKYTGYTEIFIFTNRIPVILLGYQLTTLNKNVRWSLLLCFPLGLALLYYYGYMHKLNVPFTDIYFVIGIFTVAGLYAISTFIKQSKVWDVLGIGTLELYALQMIFGPTVVTEVYRLTKNAFMTNLIVILVFFLVSIVLSKIFSIIYKKITKELSH